MYLFHNCNYLQKISLSLLFDKNNQIRKSISNMMKYLASELAMPFTDTKRVQNKLLFEEYRLCSCILGKQSIIEG